ncbi:hypothetical protein DMB38_22830 [Streptomyces sp. WAC 06738]|uniref:hypothetical protein n=1 Tax=Streptomyces sp. WAC 06738 TaxID=2203210 RepID=UPI000F70F940|nr:hypothetical protein [Streptomyces sp. WAC 06738]AZM48243.1 hypothetical protein DMB38_22830 [Streptomyces sp. WAC 06738]
MRRPTRRHTRRTHRLAAAAAAALAALGLVLGLAPPAAAGGPTSVLLVNGGSGDAAALYATHPDYAALDKAIGDAGERVGPVLTEAGLGGADARRITVTWLQHDVHVWRVDTLYPDARGGAVVSRGTGGDAATSQTWRRVEHPGRLGSLLGRLGVAERPEEQSGWYMPPQFGTDAAAPEAGGLPEPAADAGAEPGEGQAAADTDRAARREATAAGPDAGPGTNWWWTLPGLAAGALLATAAPRLYRRHRTPQDGRAGARGVLLDLDG